MRFYEDGYPLSLATRDIFGSLGNGNKYYKLFRRFVEGYKVLKLIERDVKDYTLWIYPTPKLHKLPSLDSSREQTRTQDGGGSGGTQSTLVSDELDPDPEYAKDRVFSTLKSKWLAGTDAQYDWMETELQNENERQRGMTQIIKRWDDYTELPEYVIMPMSSRFNDLHEAKESFTSFCTMLDNAAKRYDMGSMLTLTVDPKRFSDPVTAKKALMKGKELLMQWLKYRVGYRPKNLMVLELTDSGLPHLHLCLFGVSPVHLPDEQAIAEYWDSVKGVGTLNYEGVEGIAEQVRVSRISSRGSDAWNLNGNGSLRAYLGKTYYDLMAVAGGEDVRDVNDGWKLAFYWATESKIHDGTQALKRGSSDNGTSSKLYHYEYVGASRYTRIPAYIRDKALHLNKRGGELPEKRDPTKPPYPPNGPGDPGCSSRYLGHPLEDLL